MSHKVRVSARVISDLEGSDAWYAARGNKEKLEREHPDDVSLMRKVQQAPGRKDGSCTVELDDGELAALRLRGDWLCDKSRDGMSDRDTDALADYNAGAALMRQIDKLL